MTHSDRLKEIWGRCFPNAPNGLGAVDRARQEERWRAQRGVHLPLTGGIIKEQSDTLRYGPIGGTPDETPPVLLLMAGYSVEQLALVIAAHAGGGCTTVVPFSSAEVWAAVQQEVTECVSVLGVQIEIKECVDVDPASPADVFRKLLGWFQQNPGKRCAIDCTGGKKPMDSGAAHAASFYGLPAYYLDFDNYDPVLRRPLPWTCKYRELPLPETAFGLASRTRVVHAFERGRFWDAKMAMSEVVAHADGSKLFEPRDIEALKKAADQVNAAAAWMDLRYDELPDHPLHEAFKNVSKTKPRKVVEELLAPTRFDDLFQYLVDEYYRLGLLFAGEQVRDALVGLVGLAEVVIDRMFSEDWFSGTKILTATPLNWTGNRTDALPDLTSWGGGRMPRACLPPSSFNQKVNLLQRGNATFNVLGSPSGAGSAELSESAPSWDNALLVRVEVYLPDDVKPPLGDLTKKVWRDAFCNFPQGEWVQNRHALAHLRAPLLEEGAVGNARNAYDYCVPRMVELLRRLHTKKDLCVADVASPGWCDWQQTWRKEDCVPGHGTIPDLKRWLRVGA
ncbi:MAG: hypothetical protein H6716_27205 [Polyangiaceae bacterium]|nr:hypothetical protein [Polyangiaceae bacterium]